MTMSVQYASTEPSLPEMISSMRSLPILSLNLYCCVMVLPLTTSWLILLQCKKVELKGHDSYDQVYHLNTVNNQHSRIKEMFRQFRGVASKYLNRYLALFATIAT